jgi:hypothetical protein
MRSALILPYNLLPVTQVGVSVELISLLLMKKELLFAEGASAQ